MTIALRSDAGGALGAVQVNGADQLLLNSSGLLQAAQAGGLAPQFDNSLALATTSFLKQRGIQSSGVSLVTATSALTVAAAGGTVLIAAASANTQTLPALSAFPVGGRIEFMSIGAGVATIAQNAADTNGFTVNSGAGPTTLSMGAGDTLTLEKVDITGAGAYRWAAVAGSAQLGSSAAYGNSFGTNGYQKLPSGLTLQWGQATVPQSGTLVVTLPIAFPSAIYGASACSAQANMTAGSTPGAAAELTSLSQIKLQNTYSSSSIIMNWLAWGK